MTTTETKEPAESAKPVDETAPTTAMVRAPATDDAFRFALEPSDFKEAGTLAAIIAATGMCGIKSTNEALVRLMTGRTLGIPSFIALQHVYDVEGRPSISAKLKVALCLRHPDCESFEHIESDHQHAVYRAKRRGLPEKEVKFTVDDAKRAKLVKPDSNWEKWPRRMCQARASSELADILFPDACMGMPTVDEARDEANARIDEMTGEVIDNRPPPQAAPLRDFAKEAEVLKARIAEAKTPELRAAIRPEIAKFSEEAGAPWAKDVKDAYNAGSKPVPASKPGTAAPPDLFGQGQP
jgi:hypothetical protein